MEGEETLFYVNVVIKGRGRIINMDFKEDESVRGILEQQKFKFNPENIFLTGKRLKESDLDDPMVSLGQFRRWKKNTIKVVT